MRAPRGSDARLFRHRRSRQGCRARQRTRDARGGSARAETRNENQPTHRGRSGAHGRGVSARAPTERRRLGSGRWLAAGREKRRQPRGGGECRRPGRPREYLREPRYFATRGHFADGGRAARRGAAGLRVYLPASRAGRYGFALHHRCAQHADAGEDWHLRGHLSRGLGALGAQRARGRRGRRKAPGRCARQGGREDRAQPKRTTAPLPKTKAGQRCFRRACAARH